MKKLLAAVCAVLCTAGAAFAQDFRVSNELGSEGIMIMLPDWNHNNHDFGFGGLYDTVSGLVHYGPFSVQAEYKLRLTGQHEPGEELRFTGLLKRANVWFRPAPWVELAVGNSFYQATQGSYMMVYDDYTIDGNYGRNGFGATFRIADFVRIGLNLPVTQTWWTASDEFRLQLNAGVDFSLFDDDLTIGGFIKIFTSGSPVFGINASFSGLDGLYIGGGYTFRGESIAQFENSVIDTDLYYRKIDSYSFSYGRGNAAHLIDLTVRFDFDDFTIAADLEPGFAEHNNQYNPFYAGLLFGMEVADDIEFDVSAAYYGLWYNNADADERESRDRWEIYPRFTFSLGDRHEILAGCVIFINEQTWSPGDYSLGFAVPLSWKYTYE